MGVLSDVTMGKAEKNLDIKGETAKSDFLSALASEIERVDPEIDERIDITVNGDDVSINGDAVQNVTSGDFETISAHADASSVENGKTYTENLEDALKSYSLGDFVSYAFEQWLDEWKAFTDFIKEHGHEYDNIFSAIIDWNLTKTEMENVPNYVAKDMAPKMNEIDTKFPFANSEELNFAIEKYMERHPNADVSEALDKILETFARQAVGMDTLFQEIHEYKDKNDIEEFREARHEVMADMIFEHTGIDKILEKVDADARSQGLEFDFDASFQAACETVYEEGGYNSQYFTLDDFTDNMQSIYNDVDRISDKLWRNLNNVKNELKEEWKEKARDWTGSTG